MKPPVVIESGDGQSVNWLGIARSLGIHNIPVMILSSSNIYPSKYCHTMLAPVLQADPQKYLTFLIHLGHRLYQNNLLKSILFSSTDEGFAIISQNKKKLSKYFEPVCPDWTVAQQIMDKSKVYPYAKELGISVPETFQPEDQMELHSIAKSINYPCLLKPSYSHKFEPIFRVKMFQMKSPQQLEKTWITMANRGYKLLIQEEIPGSDEQLYTLGTCFNQVHQPLAVFTGQKIRQYPPKHGIASLAQSIWEPRIVDLGIKLLRNLRFYGIAQVEFKKDPRTGKFMLLDVNGRSWTWNALSTFCGVNLPYILYEALLGKKRQELNLSACNFTEGVKWVHIRLDILSMLLKRNAGEISLTQWLQSLMMGKIHSAYFSFNDFLPFLSEIRQIFKVKRMIRSIRVHAS